MRNLISTMILMVAFGIYVQSCSNSNNPSSDNQKNSTSPKELLQQEINQLEEALKAAADKPLNKNMANELIEKSVSYAKAFPDDEHSPAYLFRAGNVAVGTSSYENAVQIFNTVHNNYKSYDRSPDALFLKGFTYENHLNNKEEAKKCYNDFIKLYPEHELTKQVEVVLENIDKTPEELVKSFQKK